MLFIMGGKIGIGMLFTFDNRLKSISVRIGSRWIGPSLEYPEGGKDAEGVEGDGLEPWNFSILKYHPFAPQYQKSSSNRSKTKNWQLEMLLGILCERPLSFEKIFNGNLNEQIAVYKEFKQNMENRTQEKKTCHTWYQCNSLLSVRDT